jgi:hypothetical protein
MTVYLPIHRHMYVGSLPKQWHFVGHLHICVCNCTFSEYFIFSFIFHISLASCCSDINISLKRCCSDIVISLASWCSHTRYFPCKLLFRHQYFPENLLFRHCYFSCKLLLRHRYFPCKMFWDTRYFPCKLLSRHPILPDEIRPPEMALKRFFNLNCFLITIPC